LTGGDQAPSADLDRPGRGLLPAGAIVPAFEIQDAVNRGVLDAGHTTPGYIIGKLQAFIPLTHGPLFGMDFRFGQRPAP
jgi:TRAP-type mannitol/chloroaromatic compound transport system substrate-binding protein